MVRLVFEGNPNYAGVARSIRACAISWQGSLFVSWVSLILMIRELRHTMGKPSSGWSAPALGYCKAFVISVRELLVRIKPGPCIGFRVFFSTWFISGK
jgi:hypothetical protein